MSNEPRTTSQEISSWVRDAASSEPWRPGHHLNAPPATVPELDDFHTVRVETALRRARLKTFVKMIKPLRRIFRNQGAVNDSLIEAATHLAAQNEGMREQLAELRDLVSALQNQLRCSLPGAKRVESAVGEATESSTVREAPSVAKPAAPVP